jgi:hypothetical protein
MVDHTPWWRRLLTLEPALVRGTITALVTLGLVWGVDFTALGDQLGRTADILLGLSALIGAAWTRSVVTPTARVVQVVGPDGTVTAGPASPLPTGAVITP